MPKNIEPSLKKVGEYLKLGKSTIFEIPAYQRAYSWGIENCDKLWQDVIDYMDNQGDECYFFGTVIINCRDDDDVYSLIDGQQRTTTFLLLLKALLVNINNGILELLKQDGTPRDDDTAQFLNALCQRRGEIINILYRADTDYIPRTPSASDAKLYLEANKLVENHSIREVYRNELQYILESESFEEAERKTTKLKYRRGDNCYTAFFRNFKFFYNKASNLSLTSLNTIAKTLVNQCEVIVIKSWRVEQAITMFNSLNSDGLPLNDADIISAQLYAEAKKLDSHKEFEEKWQDFCQATSELEARDIVDISAILMQYMYYLRTIRRETVSETGSVSVTVPGVRRYFTEINKEALKEPLLVCERVTRLANIWKKVSNYDQVKILLKLNENTKIYLASYFYSFKNNDEITEESISRVADCLLRLFTILELVDAGYSSSLFKTFLFTEELKLVNNISIEEIENDFYRHIHEKWNREEIKNRILGYEKHALVLLNEYLFAREDNRKLKIEDKYQIEHIMPQSGRNKDIIRENAGFGSVDDFDGYVNKLGNKILLEGKINESISNNWFQVKILKSVQDKMGYKESKYPLARMLVLKYENQNHLYWTKEDIEEATRRAADRIVDFIFG